MGGILKMSLELPLEKQLHFETFKRDLASIKSLEQSKMLLEKYYGLFLGMQATVGSMAKTEFESNSLLLEQIQELKFENARLRKQLERYEG